jgi:hypothetical protein
MHGDCELIIEIRFRMRLMPEQHSHANRLRADPPRQLPPLMGVAHAVGSQEAAEGALRLRHDQLCRERMLRVCGGTQSQLCTRSLPLHPCYHALGCEQLAR